jgi:16S rRNA (cytosine967-C5)-methyltransferase
MRLFFLLRTLVVLPLHTQSFHPSSTRSVTPRRRTRAAPPPPPPPYSSLAAVTASGSAADDDDGGGGGADPLAARRVALEVLMQGSGRSLEVALSGHPSLPSLSQRDRSFVRLLVAVAERRQGQIDAVLATFMDRYPPPDAGGRGGGKQNKKNKNKNKNKKSVSAAQACLRLGAAQLLFLDTEAFAAVSSSVALLKEPARGAPSGQWRLVNAVLRKVASPAGTAALAERTTAADNVAPPLLAQWRKAWGGAATAKICDAMMRRPPLDLTPRAPPPVSPAAPAAAAAAAAARRRFCWQWFW